METIKLVVNGKEVEGIPIKKVYKRQRRKVVNGKEYTWDEYVAFVYVPKRLVDKKLVVVPLPE